MGAQQSTMSNSSCPAPFLDAALFPADQGYIDGRMCSPIQLPGSPPGTICCLPCPVQNYTLRPSSLEALHVNDIINVIGLGVGAFVLLVFSPAPCVTHHSLLFSFLKRLHFEVLSELRSPLLPWELMCFPFHFLSDRIVLLCVSSEQFAERSVRK